MEKTKIIFNTENNINTFLGMAMHDDNEIIQMFPVVCIEGWWRTMDFNVKCDHYNPSETMFLMLSIDHSQIMHMCLSIIVNHVSIKN